MVDKQRRRGRQGAASDPSAEVIDDADKLSDLPFGEGRRGERTLDGNEVAPLAELVHEARVNFVGFPGNIEVGCNRTVQLFQIGEGLFSGLVIFARQQLVDARGHSSQITVIYMTRHIRIK